MIKDRKLTIISVIILVLILLVCFIIFFSIYLTNNERDKENKQILKEYSIKNNLTDYNISNRIKNKLIKCQEVNNSNLYNCSIENSKKKYCLLNNEFTECNKKETLITKLKRNLKLEINKKYIFKGNDANNYLWYNGFLWRIIEFDNDSLTLITDNSITNIKANKTWKNLNDYKNGYVNYWLNDYFYNLLSNNFKDYIILSEYNIGIYNNVDNLKIRSKIGLLDEEKYKLAGGKDSYLNINDNFLLGNRFNDSYLRMINNNGDIVNGLENIIGIRPVIKIDDLANIKGNGTKNDYYYFDNDNINIGEYVDINSSYCGGLCKFRIIEHIDNKYKLILNDLIDIGNYDVSLKIINDFKNKTNHTNLSDLPRITELFTSNDIDLNKNSLSSWFWTLNNNDVYYAVNNDGLINRVDKNFIIGVRPVIYINDNLNLKGIGTYNNSYTIN